MMKRRITQTFFFFILFYFGFVLVNLVTYDKFHINSETINNLGSGNLRELPSVENVLESVPQDAIVIPHADYFLDGVFHGSNSGDLEGSCGAIATQLLLGYHNYYTDRRIIDSNYLIGYNTDPMINDMWTKGTNEFYLDYLVYNVGFGTYTPLSNFSSYIEVAALGNSTDIDVEATHGSNTDDIYDEIDAGRPVIADTHDFNDHYVVIYGYLSINSEDGFIAHIGYGDEYPTYTYGTIVWIAEEFVSDFFSVKITHVHNYDNNDNINNQYYESACSECGHRITLFEDLDLINGNITITQMTPSISGSVTLPSYIDNYPITYIEAGAFQGCSGLISVTIPSNILSIGNFAFSGCSRLNSINIMRGSGSITSLGIDVFLNTDLSIINIIDSSSFSSYLSAVNWSVLSNKMKTLFNVTFDTQGGNGGVEVLNVVYGDRLPDNALPERQGYIFLGYYSQPYGDGANYYNEDMESTCLFFETTNLVLYAKWIPNVSNYELFNADNGINYYYLVLSPTSFVIFSELGGSFDFEVILSGGNLLQVFIYNLTNDSFYNEYADYFGYIQDEIDMIEANYYLVEIYSDTVCSFSFYV